MGGSNCGTAPVFTMRGHRSERSVELIHQENRNFTQWASVDESHWHTKGMAGRSHEAPGYRDLMAVKALWLGSNWTGGSLA